jgi:hypothetical protein
MLTVGVKSSNSYRGYLHNGFWLWKFILLICLIVLSFKVPFYGIIKDCNYHFFLNITFLLPAYRFLIIFSMDVHWDDSC